jgi:hypothetical protein
MVAASGGNVQRVRELLAAGAPLACVDDSKRTALHFACAAGDKRCARCKSAYYCGALCQRAHWLGGHKAACVPIATPPTASNAPDGAAAVSSLSNAPDAISALSNALDGVSPLASLAAPLALSNAPDAVSASSLGEAAAAGAVAQPSASQHSSNAPDSEAAASP